MAASASGALCGTRVLVTATWVRAFAATTAFVIAVGLCVVLLGMSRHPNVDVGSAFQVIPRVSNAGFVVSGVDVETEIHLTDDAVDYSAEPPDDLIAEPLPAVTLTPDLAVLTTIVPVTAFSNRLVGSGASRGPPV